MRARIFTAAKAVIFCAIYVFTYVAAQLGGAVLFALLGAAGLGDYETVVMGNLFACMVFAMAASMGIYGFISLLRNDPLFSSRVRLSPISAPTVINAILAALGLRGIVAVYTVISENIPVLRESIESAPDTTAAMDTAPKILLALVIASFLAPVFEEFLFRGLVQSELLSAFPAGLSVFISSLVFAAMHGLLFQSIFTFFCGLVMGWCFYRTGSILTSMIVHIAFNSSVMFQFAVYILPWPLLIVLALLSLALIRYALKGVAEEYPKVKA